MINDVKADTTVMTAKEFVSCLKTALSRNTTYNNKYPYNLGYYNGNTISWDCWNLGKSILWSRGSIVNNYSKDTYARRDTSFGLGDWDGLTIIKKAPNCNSDFSSLVPGEWLYMNGHTGYYIGDGQVIECTPAWGANGVTQSQISSSGARSKNGSQRGSWLYHGMVPWIDYSTFSFEDGRWYKLASKAITVYKSINNPSVSAGSISANTGIIITGMYPNSRNPSWYRIDNGYIRGYIRKEDLGSVGDADRSALQDIGTVIHGNLTIKVKLKSSNLWLYAQPYAVKDRMYQGNQNQELTVKRVICNTSHHYWVQFDNGLYVCANNVQGVIMSEGNPVSINGKSFPSGELPKGMGFELRGTVSSPYEITKAIGGVYSGSPLSAISAYLGNNSGGYHYFKAIDVGRNSFDLNKSNINIAKNGGIAFGTIPEGAYTFALIVNYRKATWQDQTSDSVDPIRTEVLTALAGTSSFTIGHNIPIPVGGITFDVSSKTLWVGEAFSIGATVIPDNAVNRGLSWTSSNNSVATVANGSVKAVGKGSAVITAEAQDGSGVKATCSVTVKKPVDSVTISPNTAVLYLNETANLTAAVSPADASDTGVTWSASNGNVTVDQNGNITANAVGTATVTAKANDGTGRQGTCEVTVRAYVETVALNGSDAVNVGSDIALETAIAPSDAYNKNISWTSSDVGIASVDENGNVKGIGRGRATITATAVDRGIKTASKEIEVIQPVAGIALSGAPGVLKGRTMEIAYSVQPSNANNKALEWSSEDESIATVSGGVVTGKKTGTVTIWAKATDESGVESPYTVQVWEPVAGITVSGSEDVPVDGTISLSAEVTPSTAHNKTLVWTSDQPSVASVDEHGNVKGLQAGAVVITAAAADGSGVSCQYGVQVVKQRLAVKIEGAGLVHTGTTARLTASVTSDEPLSDAGVTWSSSDNAVVTVDSNGMLTGIANGTATITATAKAESYYYAQHAVIVDTLISRITLSGAASLDVAGTTQLSAAIEPATASNKELVWSSSKTAVAVVDGSGLVSGISEGTATITASATDGSGVKGTIRVTVYPLPDRINLTGETDLLTGSSYQITAEVLPANVRNKSVTWTSSDPTVAAVNASGLVTPVSNGTAVIAATADSNSTVSACHKVTVTTRVSSLTLSAPERVDVGGMGTVNAEILPDTASNKQLVWSSSDESIAVVDANGNVFGIGGGYVTVTARTTDGSEIEETAEIQIFQYVRKLSVNAEPLAYTGETLALSSTALPADASQTGVTWESSDENVAVVETVPVEINEEIYILRCVGSGVARITATATDGSGVSGYAYVQVLPYTELTRDSATYTLYTNGEAKATIGRVSMTANSSVRAAEDKHGAVWRIDHVSGDYAAAIGINERAFSYNGFTLTNSVDFILLEMNQAGSDTYRVTCTVNGQSDSCLVTINVEEPAAALPESVSLNPATYTALVGEPITLNTTPVLSPASAALPEGTNRFLYGEDAFSRYAQIDSYDGGFVVTFSKAGVYTAYVRYSGVNYEYDAGVTFVITTDEGTVPPEVQGIGLENSALYLLPGETAKFDVSISPIGADEAQLIWSSSDPETVTVAADGTVTAIAPGSAVITAAAANGVSTAGVVMVTESLLSIDWNPEEIIDVYVNGNSKTVIQRVFLTERASSQLTEAPSWSIKRQAGNNLTLSCEPITAAAGSGSTLYGCAVVLKSVSAVGTTEYELSCSDGNYSTSTTIRVNANSIEGSLPSIVNWSTKVFTGRINEPMSIYPVVQCWPEGTSLPDEAIISIEGDSYWNVALNRNDFTVSRGMVTFSFSEPGVYSAACVYSISNMRYLVPITVRIKDAGGFVPIRAVKLTLNQNEISVQPGQTFQMNAVVAPEDATNKTVSWSSEDASVAQVDSNGLVTGAAIGRTNIWCTPADGNCAPVKCLVVVEDEFTVSQYTEMDSQYLQGETGYAVAAFELSAGTAKRIEAEGLTPTWTLTRVSGNAANVELQKRSGRQYIIVTELLAGGNDTYRVTCNAGEHSWSGLAALEVTDIGSGMPVHVSLAQSQYTASVNEEIEFDFTPVCTPNGSAVPSGMYASYVGIGDFYEGLKDSYRISVLTARGDKVKVAFKKPGTYLLSRCYRSGNLSFVTECSVTVDDGKFSFLKCTDDDAVVYIGGKSCIASTCVIADSSIEELYGKDIVWRAERLSGDCMTVALRADQSSASLYVVNAKSIGEEIWRVSCTFKGMTDFVDIRLNAATARTELPESVSLYQTEFSGMIGNEISVPLAVQCMPAGTELPSFEREAWSFSADGNTAAHAGWTFAEDHMEIVFAKSGYYGGRLVYRSGNVTHSFPISFAVTDEESVQSAPTRMDVSLSTDTVTVYPEGETDVAVVNAVLSDSLDAYSISSIAAYAERNGAAWSLETISGTACVLSVRQINAASVQIVLDSITRTGDVAYRLNCTVAGNVYSAQGTVHVAAVNEARPQPVVRQTYFTTPTGTVLTIDASFYDRQSNIKLCDGRDSVWDNSAALAAMGFEYETAGDLWLPTFYEAGTYTTTISNMIGNLRCSQDVKIAVYTYRILPETPSSLTFPGALRVVYDEAFMGVSVNVVDLRRTNVSAIGHKAFAENKDLMRVYIPSTVNSISTDAFSGCTDFVIVCDRGSYADDWARQNDYPVLYSLD